MAAMRILGRASWAALMLSLPSLAVSDTARKHMFVCPTGSFFERSTERPVNAPLAVSITFNFDDNTSEVLVGSHSNATVGRREPIRLDGLTQENDTTITGFRLTETDTSAYWTLYVEEKRAIVSLTDIVVRAEGCIDMGAGKDPVKATSVSRRDVSLEMASFAAARHFKALMSAQDRLLGLSGELPKYVVPSVSGLMYSKIVDWAPGALESGQIDQQELFYLMAIATNYLANLAAEAGLADAASCHLKEVEALFRASRGATPERMGCRNAAYRDVTEHALRHVTQLTEPDVEDAVNLWATNAVLLGLDAVEIDLSRVRPGVVR